MLPRVSAVSAEQATAQTDSATGSAATAMKTVDDVLDGVEDDRRVQFSFRLAVALAGCAFESYSSPAIDGRNIAPAAVTGNPATVWVLADAAGEGAAPSVLREVSVSGTETTYVSA